MSKPLTSDVFKAVFEKQGAELLKEMDDFEAKIDQSTDWIDKKIKDIERQFASSAREILAHKQASDDRILAAIEKQLAWQSRCVGLMLLTVLALAGGLWRAGLL